MKKFDRFPTLYTERLTLRKLRLSDAATILRIRSDDRVNEFIDRPKTISLHDAKEFIKKINKGIKNNQSFYWAITSKKEKEVIGTICLFNIVQKDAKAEAGYELYPDYHRNGFMYEALNKLVEFAFHKVMLKTIEAVVHPQNTASGNLLEKCGFRKNEKLKMKNEKIKYLIYHLHRS